MSNKNLVFGVGALRNVKREDKKEDQEGIQIGMEKGIEKGMEKGVVQKSYEVVKNLLLVNKFTTGEIANFANVNETFVRKVKKDL